MEVVVPGHASELGSLLRATYANSRPTYLRASVATNPEGFDVHPGRIEVLRRGGAGTVLAFGPMLGRVLEACTDLDVSVLYATSLRPFDASTLASEVGDRPAVFSVEPFYEGTAAPVITEALSHLPSRFVSIGVPRAFIHDYGTPADLDAVLGLDTAGIRRRVLAHLSP